MLKRKTVIMGFFALCLTATLFIGVTTSDSHLPYDPWCDITEDGVIDVEDLTHVSLRLFATGNTTKNVTVTNWPAVMNVNVTNWQAGMGACPSLSNAFPQLLRLKGLSFESIVAGDNILSHRLFDADDMDSYTEWPKHTPIISDDYPSEWTVKYNRTFVYNKPALQPFRIFGEVLVNTKIKVWGTSGTGGNFRGNLTFLKIYPNGTTSDISVHDFGEHAPLYTIDRTIVFPFSTPVTINEGELLAIRLIGAFRWGGASGTFSFEHYYDPTKNEFLIVIPIAS